VSVENGEVGSGHGATRWHRVEHAVGARVDRVGHPHVGSRMEVAGGARLLPVTARLGLPEERLAELDGGGPVHPQGAEVRGQRDGRRSERFEIRPRGVAACQDQQTRQSDTRNRLRMCLHTFLLPTMASMHVVEYDWTFITNKTTC